MTTLSGFWIGIYAYDTDWNGKVEFEAEFTHEGSQLTGFITEANTFDPAAGDLLSAKVSGQVENGQVTFRKTYNGEGNFHHTVIYDGDLDMNENRISGQWQVGDFNGPFDMKRDGPPVPVKARPREAGVERAIPKEKEKKVKIFEDGSEDDEDEGS